MTEIVEHGVSGLLAEPGDVSSLSALPSSSSSPIRDFALVSALRVAAATTARLRRTPWREALLNLFLSYPIRFAAPPLRLSSQSISTPDSAALIRCAGEETLRLAVRSAASWSLTAFSLATMQYRPPSETPIICCPLIRPFVCRCLLTGMIFPTCRASSSTTPHSCCSIPIISAPISSFGMQECTMSCSMHPVRQRQGAPGRHFSQCRRRRSICRSATLACHRSIRYTSAIICVTPMKCGMSASVNADVARAIGVAEDRLRVIPIPVDTPALGVLWRKSRAL